MTEIYIYSILGVVAGLVAGAVLPLYHLLKFRKRNKSLEGFLESEKLIRERLQKENSQLHEIREIGQKGNEFKIQELNSIIKLMDEDIILLQKSNEETEALLHATDPVVHNLKLKLIEANNTIARYRGQALSQQVSQAK